MPAPYRPEEIAEAVVQATRAAGAPLRRLRVQADEKGRIWVVHSIGMDGSERRAIFPFASARGIYTPAEIALHLVRQRWPFG